MMSDTPLVRKLKLREGARTLILNPPDGYLAALAPLPPDVVIDDEANGTYDFVQLFVRDSAELARLAPVALASVSRDGMVWMTYPKKSSGVVSDLTRDEGWKVVAEAGYDAVANVAIDATWSAVRFRPAELVKRKSRVRAE